MATKPSAFREIPGTVHSQPLLDPSGLSNLVRKGVLPLQSRRIGTANPEGVLQGSPLTGLCVLRLLTIIKISGFAVQIDFGAKNKTQNTTASLSSCETPGNVRYHMVAHDPFI